MVPADSHRVSRAPRYSGSRWAGKHASGTGLSPPPAGLSRPFPSHAPGRGAAPTTPGAPRRTAPGLGSSPFARHYWGNHCCFLFLGVLRCFSSPRSPPAPNVRDDRPSGGRVVPFGHPRVKGRLRLTVVFRSLPRPSSPPRAKASAMRPWSLPCPLPDKNRGGRSCHVAFPIRLAYLDGPALNTCRPCFMSTTVLLVQHAKDRFPTERVKWRITDSNR